MGRVGDKRGGKQVAAAVVLDAGALGLVDVVGDVSEGSHDHGPLLPVAETELFHRFHQAELVFRRPVHRVERHVSRWVKRGERKRATPNTR